MKVFISYTTRDKIITTKFLRNLELSLKKDFEIYIDLIHNNSLEKQKRVLSELQNSDLLLIIETIQTYNSEWVKLEIEQAKKQGIQIHRIKFDKIKELIETKNMIPYAPTIADGTFLANKQNKHRH